MAHGRVIARIMGGLGNQLFQYAAARRLAIHNNIPLTLDHLSGFPRDFYKRSFLLDHFNIKADYIRSSAAYVSFAGRLRRRLRMRVNRGRPLEAQRYLVERDSDRCDPRMLELRVTRPVYLEGYWQHEEYFKDIREQLCQELTLRTPHDPVNIEFAEKIKAVEAVCLHVRRLHGVPNKPDAAPLADANRQHIDASYYQKAVERLVQDIKQPHFFVFSDYPDWAKEHVHTSYPIEYVTYNGADRDYEDFWLMGQCRHFIVANSTFSWWAAWLSQNPGKRVIAPQAAIGQMLKSVPPSWTLV